jgi:hypothetical protein
MQLKGVDDQQITSGTLILIINPGVNTGVEYGTISERSSLAMRGKENSS